jgi:telomeric repeat-binding factor 2-interacting protein 1
LSILNKSQERLSKVTGYIKSWANWYEGHSQLTRGQMLICKSQYPSHSWQSWRSRYIKHLNGKDRPGGGVPRSHEELIQSAPAQGQYPKTLPTRTETAPKEKMSSGVSQPQSSALTPNNTMISSKRKRDPVPAVSNPSRTQVSPSKRRAIEASTSTGSLFLRGSDQTCGPQPRSPTITTPPGLTQGPTRDTHGTSSSSRRPIEGLGLVNLPTQTLPTQSPQQTAHGPALRPEDNAQKPARVPRPLGDNAFAKFGRFKKQEHKAAPPVADPYKDPVDPVFLELPFLPSSPASEVAEEDTEEIPDVDSWIDQRLARGANESHVFDALRCTSMIPEMADRVLESLAAGNDIPNDIPGVWTAEDDQCLQAQDHSEVQRALSKHGSEAFKERWEYLRMARETGLID